jgi:SAM-dependent methyltransferase
MTAVSTMSDAAVEPTLQATCPICGGAPRGLAFPFVTTWNGIDFHYRACGVCGSAFVDPVPTEAQLKSIYSWGNYHSRHYDTIDRARYRETLDLLQRRWPTMQTVLDFGCGGGGFLAAARNAGYDCRGVEYEASAIAEAQRRAGVSVTNLDELAASGVSFDVIRLADVHPHLPDPAAMFRALEPFLVTGGVFLVEGPLEKNASLVYCIASTVKGTRRWLGLDHPATIAPTMLVRVNQRAQREFFRQRLGYHELYFEVFETGWPFYVSGRPLRSFGDRVKQMIGAIAVALGRLQRGQTRRLGNRFLGVYMPVRDDRS